MFATFSWRCPWADARLCPAQQEGTGDANVFRLRIDSSEGEAALCACQGPGGPEGAAYDLFEGAPPENPPGRLFTEVPPLRTLWRRRLPHLRTLFKEPKAGLAALALSMLPPLVAARVLQESEAGRPLSLTINRGRPDDPEEDMVIVGFRALGAKIGMSVEVRNWPGLPPHSHPELVLLRPEGPLTLSASSPRSRPPASFGGVASEAEKERTSS